MNIKYRVNILYRRRALGPAIDTKDVTLLDEITDIDDFEKKLIAHSIKKCEQLKANYASVYLDKVDLDDNLNTISLAVYSISNSGKDEPRMMRFPTTNFEWEKTKTK
jgi:hypothetical protein